MQINAIFEESSLPSSAVLWREADASSLKMRVDGKEWRGEPDINIKTSILDFIDASDDESWVEIDFANNKLYFGLDEISGLLLAPVFYPEQDLRYKSQNPKVLNIMRSIFKILRPLLVIQDEGELLPALFKGDTFSKISTSFLAANQNILPPNEASKILRNSNLYYVEWLTDDIIWLNGPLGLGDEYSRAVAGLGSLTASTSQDHPDIEAFRQALALATPHQDALKPILNSINLEAIRAIRDAAARTS